MKKMLAGIFSSISMIAAGPLSLLDDAATVRVRFYQVK